MLDRNEILERAYTECMAEMYAKSQPSADYYQLLEDAKNGDVGDQSDDKCSLSCPALEAVDAQATEVVEHDAQDH